jgi:argininosuccinate lyase
VRAVLSVRGALASRSTYGGTAPARVGEQLAELADAASRHAAWATGAG